MNCWREFHRLQIFPCLYRSPRGRGSETNIDCRAATAKERSSASGNALQKLLIPEASTAALHLLAEESGGSLNNVVQTAWAILLARYQSTEEAVFGTVRSCRHSALDGQAADMVGLLINTLPVRCRMPSGTTVRSVFQQLKDQQRRMREHENTPLPAVVRLAGLAAGELLFNTVLMFETAGLAAGGALAGNGQWSTELHEETEFLSLSVIAGSDLKLSLEYRRDRYSDTDMERFLGDFGALLMQLPLNMDQRLDRLSFFTPSLVCNPPARTLGRTIADAVRHWSREKPGALAVCSSRGNLTWRELEESSNGLAHWLVAKGVATNALVGLALERSPAAIVASVGVWKAGCAWLPVDPQYPPRRREYMIADSDAALVLTSIPNSAAPVSEAPVNRAPTGQDAAYVIYTSGSTGVPKGVAISHESLAQLCAEIGREFCLNGDDRVLQASTVSFDISVEEIYPTLWAGATLILRDDETMSSTAEFAEFVGHWRCTVLDLPTAFWHELVRGLQVSGRSLGDSVRLLVVGGERVLPGIYRAWQTLPDGARVRWLNTYGPTETTVTATVFDPATLAGWDESSPDRDLPIGRPLGYVNAYVLDSTLAAVPLGTAGELFIGGAGVGLGYLKSPESTDAVFLPDPYAPGARMYRTGDRVRLLSEGQLDFIGRLDFQLKFRGFRLDPREIEKAAEAHRDIDQAVVMVRNGNALSLFACRRLASGLDDGGLSAWLKGLLPAWMIPESIVVTDVLPLTINGKIDREALLALPVLPDTARSTGSAMPETESERQLAELWEDLFQKTPIGVDENFFSLGGYSLLAMRMLAGVERLTGQRLTFGTLSRAPTIRQLAGNIKGRVTEEPSPRMPEFMVPLGRGAGGPPLFCFHGAGGVVHWYNDLAAALSDIPVTGVQSPEGAAELLPGSVEEMAELYFGGIRRVQPGGPYCFLGHSMGGVLAYHCSVLAVQAGESVAFTGILDGWNRRVDNPSTPEKIRRWMVYLMSLTSAEKKEFFTEKIQWLRAERSQKNARREAGLDTSALDSVKANNVQAARKYDAPKYHGIVHVFRARRRSATEAPDPTLGWEKVAAEVITHEVGGSHYTLLSPPHIQGLAATIRQILRQALG